MDFRRGDCEVFKFINSALVYMDRGKGCDGVNRFKIERCEEKNDSSNFEMSQFRLLSRLQ